MAETEEVVDTNDTKLTDEEKDRAERNRQKALLIKKSKMISQPHSQDQTVPIKKTKTVIDSGAGFLIEEDDDLESEMCNIAADLPPIISKLPKCEECDKEFKDSYLLQKFDYPACDECRDNDGKHSLITRTEAKQEYLLKDCDLDKREPPLKYILRKNPHNIRWGEMKLYLQIQIEKRALEVWETEEALIEEKEKRDRSRQEAKVKKFNKKIDKLRKEVRSSLYDKTQKASHTHKFGGDVYNEDEDNYSHTCSICGFEETFEKM